MLRLSRRASLIGFALIFGVSIGVYIIRPPMSETILVDGNASHYGTAPTGVVSGAFHVHSESSDGSGSLAEISKAAMKAGLDFVILTDHGDGTRQNRPAIYQNGVLLVEAVEISTDAGHYIALDLPRSPYPLGGEAKGVVEDVARLGGFGIVAHPTSTKEDLTWENWNLPFDGIEWLNADSEWRDESLPSLVGAAIGYWTRPAESMAALLDRPGVALARWDEQTSSRRVVGFGGSDAHAKLPIGVVGPLDFRDSFALEFPTYEAMFRLFAVRVELPRRWTGDPSQDAGALLDGIRSGRTFTAVDAIAKPVHFSFQGEQSGVMIQMGESVSSNSAVTLRSAVEGPIGTEMVLLKQGRVVTQTFSSELSHVVPMGASSAGYRVEVQIPNVFGTPPVPWIVSNPIYIGFPVELKISEVSVSDRLNKRFMSANRWGSEYGQDARVNLDVTDKEVTIQFELGSNSSTYAAAVYDLGNEELLSNELLVFDAVASRPMRVAVHLRVPSEDYDIRWKRSFFVGTTRSSVRLAFEDFIAIDQRLSNRPELSNVDDVLLVIDTTNSSLESQGTLILSDIHTVFEG